MQTLGTQHSVNTSLFFGHFQFQPQTLSEALMQNGADFLQSLSHYCVRCC